MRRIAYLFLLSFILVSCGTRKGHFKIEGRFLHINQGELYVYSPDGGIDGMDTIKIDAGRFAYETPMKRNSTLMLVFPNFSEHPVFAESGGAVDIKADASHLKEMTVEGTDENELMNTFRELVANASPPEEKKYAEQFAKDHPESLVSVYLVRKYFILSEQKDYKKAAELLTVLMKNQPENVALGFLLSQVKAMMKHSTGAVLPAFSATDLNGNKITGDYLKSQDAVILVWASWAYDSFSMRQLLNSAQKESGGKLKVFGICVDPNPKDCKNEMERYNIEFPVVCDGQMIDSKLLAKLGIGTVPYNIVLRNGRITETAISYDEMKKRFKYND